MSVLTSNEGDVIQIVRKQARHGHPVASATVKRLARPMSYDAVDRALRGLLAKGLVTKSARGYWLPVDADTGSGT